MSRYVRTRLMTSCVVGRWGFRKLLCSRREVRWGSECCAAGLSAMLYVCYVRKVWGSCLEYVRTRIRMGIVSRFGKMDSIRKSRGVYGSAKTTLLIIEHRLMRIKPPYTLLARTNMK